MENNIALAKRESL
jgi:hypothetical protein